MRDQPIGLDLLKILVDTYVAMRKRSSIAVVALLAVLGLTAVRAQSAAALVELREVDLTYPAEAVVEAVNEATVAAQVRGRIVEVRFDAGQRVKRGELLMRIDEREAAQALAGAEAQVAQARANLTNAKATFERTKNLFAQKFISQAALDQAESSYRAAEAQLKAALAERGQAGTAKSFTAVTAPIAGVVAQRHAELGEMAEPGKPLMTIFDPKGLRVVASIPQYKLAEFKSAPRAKVEFPETGRWIDAAAVTILPTADARTHVVQARVRLPDDVPAVAPGMFARAYFITGRAKKLLVPAQAVLRRGEVTAVYVLDTKGGSQLRQVRLGDLYGGQGAESAVEVLAGVSAGEQVALDPVKAGIARATSASGK